MIQQIVSIMSGSGGPAVAAALAIVALFFMAPRRR